MREGSIRLPVNRQNGGTLIQHFLFFIFQLSVCEATLELLSATSLAPLTRQDVLGWRMSFLGAGGGRPRAPGRRNCARLDGKG